MLCIRVHQEALMRNPYPCKLLENPAQTEENCYISRRFIDTSTMSPRATSGAYFERTALQAAGALDLASATPSTLTNPIHPIFRATNFPSTPKAGKQQDGRTGTTPSVYNTMRPALRLASHFLTHPVASLWWYKLILGEIIGVVGEDREVLVDRIGKFGEASRMLIEHAEHVAFCWRPDSRAHASTWPIATNRSNSLVCLNERVRDFVEGEYHSSSPSHQLRFQFHLALNLCHELAHSVMIRRQLRREPYFNNGDPENELGAAWEYFAFGGKIQPVNYSPSAADGLIWYPWQTGQANQEADMRNEGRHRAVSMRWVASMFEMDAWKKVRPEMILPTCAAVRPLTTDFKKRSTIPSTCEGDAE